MEMTCSFQCKTNIFIKKMEKLQSTYRTYEPIHVCFLNSAYVDKVLKEYPGYANTMITCNVHQNEIAIDTNGLKLDKNSKIDIIVRFRIKVFDPEKEDYDYHVNLLIFNMTSRTIEHFEPLELYELGEAISTAVKTHFNVVMPTFKFRTLDFHPQKELDNECKNMGLCVAHVIKFATCHLYCTSERAKLSEPDEEDVYRFAAAIVDQY